MLQWSTRLITCKSMRLRVFGIVKTISSWGNHLSALWCQPNYTCHRLPSSVLVWRAPASRRASVFVMACRFSSCNLWGGLVPIGVATSESKSVVIVFSYIVKGYNLHIPFFIAFSFISHHSGSSFLQPDDAIPISRLFYLPTLLRIMGQPI